MMSLDKAYGSRYGRKSRRSRKVDEASWEEAKSHAADSYPNISHGSDRFWSVVQTIYQNMTKSDVEARYLLKAENKNPKERQVAPPTLWEPPGGTHPKTWRTQIGQGKYLYRVSPPKEREAVHGKEGEVFTPGQVQSIKQRISAKEKESDRQSRRGSEGIPAKHGANAISAINRVKTAEQGSKESQSAISDAVESAKYYFESGKMEEAAMILRRLISSIPEADAGKDPRAEEST